jgi:hypothetical protein
LGFFAAVIANLEFSEEVVPLESQVFLLKSKFYRVQGIRCNLHFSLCSGKPRINKNPIL